MIVSRLAFGAMTFTGGDRSLGAVFKTKAAAASAAAPPAASGAPLVVDSLVKRFGAVTAVDGISLELRAGECFGLLGPNGAGKNTLIRAIASRGVPDSGRVAVFGSAAGSRQARAALGWVPQELALYPRLTARENLRSFGRYNGMRGKELDESVAWCLNWASLEDRAGELTRNLSGGMKRRLNMAAGLIHHPRLVLMDEPTVGVDPQSRNRIFEMIEALRRLLASVCHTRAQLGALSTLLILTMSAIGGSLFPRVPMSETLQKAGLWTLNAWAIDGFTKVFWRDQPVSTLWPQVAVLLGTAIVLLAVARRLARRWDDA